MEVAICGLNYYDLDKQYQKNNLTIKIISSLNVDYIFDKKTYMVFYVCLSSSFIIFITHASIIFFNTIFHINKDNIHYFSHN